MQSLSSNTDNNNNTTLCNLLDLGHSFFVSCFTVSHLQGSAQKKKQKRSCAQYSDRYSTRSRPRKKNILSTRGCGISCVIKIEGAAIFKRYIQEKCCCAVFLSHIVCTPSLIIDYLWSERAYIQGTRACFMRVGRSSRAQCTKKIHPLVLSMLYVSFFFSFLPAACEARYKRETKNKRP